MCTIRRACLRLPNENDAHFFDFREHFVLDIEFSVSIIYIWYEDGLLKLFLVT